jgi:SAM-dependent methyltransferase
MRVGCSPWSEPDVVAGFASALPNRDLMDYAARHHIGSSGRRVLDIGCGAGRNAVPLALSGAIVIGTDVSMPMLQAAHARPADRRLHLAVAAMDALPVPDRSIDLIVAHGIWNLARSGTEFRGAIAEAARAAAKGAALFVFTFSRHTLQPDAAPVAGETFVFTQFSGAPQTFLTRDQLLEEVGSVGFAPDPELPISELNLPPPGQFRIGGAPVIFQAAFRFTGA